MRISWSFLTAAGLLVGTAILLQSVSHGEVIPVKKSLAELPLSIASWEGRELGMDQEILDVLKLDDFIMRSYASLEDTPVWLYVGYYQSQRQGSTYHSPKNCLPGGGWDIMRSESVMVQVPGFPQMTVNKVLIQKGLEQQVVLYWYHDRGRVIASEYWAKIYLVYDAMTRNRTDGALVRITLPVRTSLAEASQDGMRFLETVFPFLVKHLPQ